jgi:putative DNA primase/helicase
VIAGDNDAHLELTEGKNPGKEKALAAAKAVDGSAIFPIFAPGEQSYPDKLELVTPLTVRSGSLTDEQQMAIAKLKRYTDFNDLLINSVLGRYGLEHQVKTGVNMIIENQKKHFVVRDRQEQKLFVKMGNNCRLINR